MKCFAIVFLACVPLLSSAATKSGTITLKLNPSLIQVSLGDRDVVVGDRVSVFKKDCRGGGKNPLCTIERVGGGAVSRVLNETYSEIQLDSGVHVSEGYIVERQR